MEILLILPGFILAIIVLIRYGYKIHSNSLKIGKNVKYVNPPQRTDGSIINVINERNHDKRRRNKQSCIQSIL